MFRTFLLWCAVLLLEGSVVVLIVPATVVTNAATTEEALIASSLGQDAADDISQRARETFDRLFVDTGILAESFHLFVPTEQAKRNSTGIETLASGIFDVVRRRLESFWNLVFVGIQRAYSFWIWLPMLLPFVVAAAFDGATVRRVKLLTFGMSSAPRYGAAVHALVFLCFAPLFYAAYPFSVTPLLVPLWFIALSLVIRLLVSNLQRM